MIVVKLAKYVCYNCDATFYVEHRRRYSVGICPCCGSENISEKGEEVV